MLPPIKEQTKIDLAGQGGSADIDDVVLISVGRNLEPAPEFEPKPGVFGALPQVRSMKDYSADSEDAQDPGRWASFAVQLTGDQLLRPGQRKSEPFAKFGEGRGALFVHLQRQPDGSLKAPGPGEPGHMVVRQSFGGHFLVESGPGAQTDAQAGAPQPEELRGRIFRQRAQQGEPAQDPAQKPGASM